VLLVDDSEAVIGFEKAALGGLYTYSVAANGREALDRVVERTPDLILLDLSMPVLDGEEVLARLKSDRELSRVPVIVVSSERERSNQCLSLGASAVHPKPVVAGDLRALVARTLEAAVESDRRELLPAIVLRVGDRELAVRLESVSRVLPETATKPLARGRAWLRELLDLHGKAVPVLDMARRLRTEYRQPLLDRLLVVVDGPARSLALRVDTADDPDELAPRELDDPSERARFGPLAPAVVAVARRDGRSLAVIEPARLLSRKLLVSFREAGL